MLTAAGGKDGEENSGLPTSISTNRCLATDEEGRLWYHGRKSHRIETSDGLLLPVPVENICNTLDGVRRTALVGVGERGSERPTLIVEPEQGASKRDLRQLFGKRATRDAMGLELGGVLFKKHFPVDVRHNAKIKRGELKRWAEKKTR